MYSKMQGAAAWRERRVLRAGLVDTMISPGSTSRMYLAPIMSSAQVSESGSDGVEITSTKGRMPSGSRGRQLLVVSATSA